MHRDVTPSSLPSPENVHESARNPVRYRRVYDDISPTRSTISKNEIDNDLLVAAMR